MTMKAILHVPGEESIFCDLETLPEPTHNFVIVYNPTRRDGKPLPTLDQDATSFLFPLSRITFIEIFEERAQRETVVGFFRETDARRRLP